MGSDLYDVIVVGAGPGGSAAAILLVQMGWKVLLLDKARFPRDKVCGDFISPRSLRVLESLGCKTDLEQTNPNRLNSASLYLNGEQITSGEIPEIEGLASYGYTSPRAIFDEVLFRRAQQVGVVTIENCEVKDLTIHADRAILRAKQMRKLCSFNGKLVIAADGAHSVIARALGVENRDSKNVIMALRSYYDGEEGDPSRADIFFNETYFPGYAWIFPLGGGRANVGMGMVMDVYQRYEINLRERLIDWIEHDPFAQARLGKARLDGRIVGWPLNTYCSIGSNCAERVLLIGDAGSFVDPINGEGIHTALESARIASRVADEALHVDDYSVGFLSRYERRWRTAFDLDMRTADLIVTIIKNRNLSSVWLLILKMIAQKALSDRVYANTCGGILSGVVPTHHSLSPIIIVKTLMQSPDFWQRNLGLALDRGLPSFLNSGLLTASGVLDALSQLAGQPTQTLEWGLDVATRGLDLLTSLSETYSDDLMLRLFDAFFQSWLSLARHSSK